MLPPVCVPDFGLSVGRHCDQQSDRRGDHTTIRAADIQCGLLLNDSDPGRRRIPRGPRLQPVALRRLQAAPFGAIEES